MARDRNHICVHYIHYGECAKGKFAEVHGTCQKCPFYLAKPGSKPLRTDNRAKKKEKIRKEEESDY